MVTMTTFKDRNEWLEGRKGRIGGSDAACIVGMNPYKTNIELFFPPHSMKTILIMSILLN